MAAQGARSRLIQHVTYASASETGPTLQQPAAGIKWLADHAGAPLMNLARRCSIIPRASEGKSGSTSGMTVSFGGGGGAVPPSGSGGSGGGGGGGGDGDGSSNEEEGPVLSYKEVGLTLPARSGTPHGATWGALLWRTGSMGALLWHGLFAEPSCRTHAYPCVPMRASRSRLS